MVETKSVNVFVWMCYFLHRTRFVSPKWSRTGSEIQSKQWSFALSPSIPSMQPSLLLFMRSHELIILDKQRRFGIQNKQQPSSMNSNKHCLQDSWEFPRIKLFTLSEFKPIALQLKALLAYKVQMAAYNVNTHHCCSRLVVSRGFTQISSSSGGFINLNFPVQFHYFIDPIQSVHWTLFSDWLKPQTHSAPFTLGLCVNCE